MAKQERGPKVSYQTYVRKKNAMNRTLVKLYQVENARNDLLTHVETFRKEAQQYLDERNDVRRSLQTVNDQLRINRTRMEDIEKAYTARCEENESLEKRLVESNMQIARLTTAIALEVIRRQDGENQLYEVKKHNEQLSRKLGAALRGDFQQTSS
jgi:chromosome segregation ATPase